MDPLVSYRSIISVKVSEWCIFAYNWHGWITVINSRETDAFVYPFQARSHRSPGLWLSVCRPASSGEQIFAFQFRANSFSEFEKSVFLIFKWHVAQFTYRKIDNQVCAQDNLNLKKSIKKLVLLNFGKSIIKTRQHAGLKKFSRKGAALL